jgi:hypothetical protein
LKYLRRGGQQRRYLWGGDITRGVEVPALPSGGRGALQARLALTQAGLGWWERREEKMYWEEFIARER